MSARSMTRRRALGVLAGSTDGPVAYSSHQGMTEAMTHLSETLRGAEKVI